MMTARQVNKLIKENPSHGIFLVSKRFHHPLRIIRAKTVHTVLFVKTLHTGKWTMVFASEQITEGN